MHIVIPKEISKTIINVKKNSEKVRRENKMEH
jgi:hypothetical protein